MGGFRSCSAWGQVTYLGEGFAWETGSKIEKTMKYSILPYIHQNDLTKLLLDILFGI